MKRFNNARFQILIVAILALGAIILTYFYYPRQIKYGGFIFGTNYNILIRDSLINKYLQYRHLHSDIDQELNRLNNIFSIHKVDSELNQFNKWPIEKIFRASRDLHHVITLGRLFYERTSGAWDGSVYPILKLWGFDRMPEQMVYPKESQIKALLPFVNYSLIKIKDKQCLLKQYDAVQIDLSSIAKGYAVDMISKMLKEKGVRYFIVEIGGEVFVSDYYRLSGGWKVGVSRPDPNAHISDIISILELRNSAVATSGDYRKYFLYQNKRYAHIINPKTGYPIENKIASVTVVAPSCVLADGYATGLMVMTVEDGLILIDSLDNTEAMIITRQGGSYVYHYSKGFKKYLSHGQ